MVDLKQQLLPNSTLDITILGRCTACLKSKRSAYYYSEKAASCPLCFEQNISILESHGAQLQSKEEIYISQNAVLSSEALQ